MGKTVEKVEEKLQKVVPAEFKVDVHHWLICMGATPALPANHVVDLVLLKIYVSLKIKRTKF